MLLELSELVHSEMALLTADMFRKEEKAYHLCVQKGLKDGDFTVGEFLCMLFVSTPLNNIALHCSGKINGFIQHFGFVSLFTA